MYQPHIGRAALDQGHVVRIPHGGLLKRPSEISDTERNTLWPTSP
jgi:hypothetical protein